MTLDTYYNCNQDIDLYAAALAVQLLLNQTYSMGSKISPITSIGIGTGYEVEGDKI